MPTVADTITVPSGAGVYGGRFPPVPPSLTWTAPSPAGSEVGVASGNFTATLVDGVAAVVVTPISTLAGTWAPSSRTLSPAAPGGTFTFTPAAAGSHSATLANNAGIASPAALSYVVTVPTVRAMTFAAADTATVNVAVSGSITNTGNVSQAWSITPPSGVTVTPSSGTLAAGGTQALSITATVAATYTLTLVAAGATITGNPQSIVASSAAPTTATLSGSTTATTAVAQNYTVTLNAPADRTYTITWARSNSGTGSATSTIAPGASSATATSAWAASGAGRTVDFTISPTLTRAGRPITVNVTDAAAPGTVTTVGSQSLNDYLGTVRTALFGDLTAADARLMQRNLALSYCGATIWRDKLAFPVLGGHGDSYDDGGYAFDLATGTWSTLIAPSTYGSTAATINAQGEYAADSAQRPASQHTYWHLITVGDDMVQCLTSFAGSGGLQVNSQQAHRWKGSTGLWERYGGIGQGGVSPGNSAFCHHDARRNRIVRIDLAGVYGKVDTIPDNDPNAAWTSLTISGAAVVGSGINISIGYHEALDCYVLIDPGSTFTPGNSTYTMDAANITAGWTLVSAPVTLPTQGNIGLEYCPPMRAFASVDPTDRNKLLYLKPTGTRTDPWVWSSETFTGSTETWDGYTGGDYNGVYSRFRWSELLRGFVMLKKSTAKVELYVPREVAAYYDWQARAAAAIAAGVTYNRGAVAYDFSDQPANGGDWKWGSLSASPKVTCEARNRTYDTPQANLPDHARDLVICPPGSHGSLRLRVPQGVANAGDEWRFGIDDFDKQFREGDEFWVCWRTRLNATAATHHFKRTSNDTLPGGELNTSSTWDGQWTDAKHSFWGYGMQTPKGPGQEATTGTYYGYSPGASQSDNVMASCRTDVRGEIVMRLLPDFATPGPGTVFKYPSMYVGKPGAYPLETKGQNINYWTQRNGGDETTGNNTGVAKACEYIDPGSGLGNQYTDYSTCFIYPTDEWFSLMTHVVLGQPGTATQAGTSEVITGYINSVVEYYGAYAGQPWSLLHRRTLHISYDAPYPGGQGIARFGMFGWTSYMTAKWRYETHPDSLYWVSQIIVQPGPTMPAAPI